MSKQSGAGTVVLALVAVGALGLLWFSWGGGDDQSAASREVVGQRSVPAAGLPVAQPRAGHRLAERRGLEASGSGESAEPAVPRRRVAGVVGLATGGDHPRAREMPSDRAAESMARAARKAPEESFDTTRFKALTDPDPDERIQALESLNSFEGQPVVPILTQALSDQDSEVRLAALEELTFATDDPPLDALSIALNDSDPEVRSTALRMVADSEDEARWPLIRNALEEPDEDVRSEAEDIIDLDGEPDGAR